MSFSFNGYTWYPFDMRFVLAEAREYDVNPGPTSENVPASMADDWLAQATVSVFSPPGSGGDPKAGIWLSEVGNTRAYGIGERNGSNRGIWDDSSFTGISGLVQADVRVHQENAPQYTRFYSQDGGINWTQFGNVLSGLNPSMGTALEHYSSVWGTPNFTSSISNLLLYSIDSTLEGPTLVSPADEAVDQPATLDLTWSAPNPTSRLVVSVNQDLSSPVVDLSGLSVQTKEVSLDYETTYYWGVQKDSTGGWSEIWSFTTEAITKVSHLMLMGVH